MYQLRNRYHGGPLQIDASAYKVRPALQLIMDSFHGHSSSCIFSSIIPRRLIDYIHYYLYLILDILLTLVQPNILRFLPRSLTVTL
jgi:hypothetical protein